MKRRFDEKTIGMDLLVHKELKILADQKGLKMKDLLMNILTNYITTKTTRKKDEEMQVFKVWKQDKRAQKNYVLFQAMLEAPQQGNQDKKVRPGILS